MGQKLCFFEGSDLVAMPKKSDGVKKDLKLQVTNPGCFWEKMAAIYLDVSENSGTPKSSILIGFSIINHPFWGIPIFRNTHL